MKGRRAFPHQWIAALRSECPQNYREGHFLRQTGFRIPEKAPEVLSAKLSSALRPEGDRVQKRRRSDHARRTIVSIGAVPATAGAAQPSSVNGSHFVLRKPIAAGGWRDLRPLSS